MMDASSQDPETLPGSTVDHTAVKKPRYSRLTLPEPALLGKMSSCAEANEKMSTMKGDAKGVEMPDSETEAPPKEPPSSEPQSPLKKRPSSTRTSADIFRSLTIEGADGKSKQNRLSVGDSSSIHTIDSNDDRRLSDKMKKAWREVRGQSRLDPLEQWMVKHSGGTFKEKARRQAFGESSDR
ncbi:hypothetical protein GGR55DRAFT_254995 [Xylaria sp. FL0064]|nr:hypothetical protein GGR55DRAFT_254995 [Xylaria sp. FL0064]